MTVHDTAWYRETLAYVERRHHGKTDKLGRPYYEHFTRVVDRLLDHAPHATPAQVQAALLHDALEPDGVTAEELRRQGVEESAIRIIQRITLPTDGRDYMQYIEELVAHGDRAALEVKLADNADAVSTYTENPTLPGAELLEARFIPARKMLKDALAR